MTDDPKKRRAVEAVQALLLQYETAIGHLNNALDATVDEDYEDAEVFLRMADETMNAEINAVSALIRGEPAN